MPPILIAAKNKHVKQLASEKAPTVLGPTVRFFLRSPDMQERATRWLLPFYSWLVKFANYMLLSHSIW